MPIKMRLRKSKDTNCEGCGCDPNKTLDMFDLMIGEIMITLCDECVEALMTKTLKAKCYTNGRVKQPKEIRIINDRARRRGSLR